MQLDKLLMFSENAPMTGGNSAALDLGDNGDELSRKLHVFAKTQGAPAGGTSYGARLETSDDGTTNWETLVSYTPRSLAQLQKDGDIIPPQPLPAGLKRHVRLVYALAGTFTGATVTAGLTPSVEVGL